jgi:hypothetical protein
MFVIFAVFQLLSPAAAGDVVYRWVDEDGITHFSDSPPAARTTAQGDVESIALPENLPAAVNPAEDYYSIVNQWKRMREERNEREKLALEEERLRLEQSRAELAASATLVAVNTTPSVIYGGAPRFVQWPFLRKKHKYHGLQPVLYHGTPRRDFTSPAQPRRQYSRAHFKVGNSGLVQMPLRAARATFK